MSPPGCQKMSAKPCNRNAEERFPVLSLKSREQKPPNPLLIQDKDVLQPTPGVFSVLQQLAYAQRQGLRYHYLGYWIAGCPSMAYKAQYRPHEVLVWYPPDDVEPAWIAG